MNRPFESNRLSVVIAALLLGTTGCGGNTPGQQPESDSSTDIRVQRDLPAQPDSEVTDVPDLDATDDATTDDTTADDTTADDATSDAAQADAPRDSSSEPDIAPDLAGRIDCSTLTECNYGETGWCEDDSYASCGTVDESCQRVVTPCGIGFMCASISAQCLDGRPGGDTCDDAVSLSLGSFSLTTVSYHNRYEEYRGNCDIRMNIWGPDRVFALSPNAGETWTVTAQGQPQVDIVLALVSSCADVMGSCEQYIDEGRDGAAETVTIEGDDSGATWYLVVDGWGTMDLGPFTLSITDM